MRSALTFCRSLALALAALWVLAAAGPGASAAALLEKFLPKVEPAEMAPGATSFGPMRADIAAAPVLKDGETIAWVYLTSDFVSTTGYSGKPIHTLVAIDADAVLTGVRLVKHSEPIVLIGIPERRIRATTEAFAGLDIKAEAKTGGGVHDLEIITGATVTIIVIEDSVVRSAVRVARGLGLGGLGPLKSDDAPKAEIESGPGEIATWQTLLGDGSVRRLSLDIGQVNEAYRVSGEAEAAGRPEAGDDTETFIDLHAALVSVPTIGRSLLGDAEYQNLLGELGPDEHALFVGAKGRYSFKGSGYVRGGLFDRITLIQGDTSIRFRDRQHRRLGRIAAAGAPGLTELDIFRIPADAEFDPAAPWRLQLLVSRATGPVKKSFLTFDLGYRLPDKYIRQTAAEAVAPLAAPSAGPTTVASEEEAAAKRALWQRIWRDRQVQIGVLVAAIGLLTAFFFFQMPLTRNETFVFWFRIAFLSFVLVWVGWFAGAQLSVVNVLAVFSALTTNFSWDAFLLDPLVFILWFSVAASLIFWGRGAYCGWLCPFGALQELTNRLAKLVRIPQWTVPWGLHERLWPLKYIIFLGLFGTSLYSLDMAEAYAEVEPFKTAIVLKFDRAWPYLLYVGLLLGAGLFVERFYCRYLCPLGAALAIPTKLRAFEWLKRYRECGSPCQRCAKECMVQAIHPDGHIDPNECLYCMHCQVLYQSDSKCPVCIAKLAKRERYLKRTNLSPDLPRPSPATAGGDN